MTFWCQKRSRDHFGIENSLETRSRHSVLTTVFHSLATVYRLVKAQKFFMALMGFYLAKALNSRVLCVFGNVVLLFLKYE